MDPLSTALFINRTANQTCVASRHLTKRLPCSEQQHILRVLQSPTMVNTTPPRRYRFSISRFEAYEGQNELYTTFHRDKDELTTRLGRNPISNRRHSTSSLPKKNSVDGFGDGKVKYLEELKSSFKPSRIGFLRNMLEGRVTSTEVELGDEDGGLPPSPPSVLYSDEEARSEDKLCSPEKSAIPETSRRFSEILAGRERPSPRAKYRPNRRAEEAPQLEHHGGDLGNFGLGEAKGRELQAGLEEKKERSVEPMVTKEGAVGAEKMGIRDTEPSFGKLDLETKKKRVAMIKRRRFSMMMKTSSIWASSNGSF